MQVFETETWFIDWQALDPAERNLFRIEFERQRRAIEAIDFGPDFPGGLVSGTRDIFYLEVGDRLVATFDYRRLPGGTGLFWRRIGNVRILGNA